MTINTSILESYRELMEEEADEFIADILDSFYENSNQLINTLKEARLQGKSGEFVRAAHTFKSTSATVGAERLSSLAAELEKRGQNENLSDLLPLMASLQDAFEEAQQELNRLYPLGN